MTQRILIVGPAWVGDMVMAQSLFKLIKQQNKEAVIDVLAPAWTFSLLSRMPEVNEALDLPLARGEFNLRKRYQLGKALRQKKYDQAIILPNSFKSALIPWFARIPKRTGWLGECRYLVLNDPRRLDKKRYPLMIEQFMALGVPSSAALTNPYPYPHFQVIEGEAQKVIDKYNLKVSDRPILALCPGAAYGPSKRWPEEYFAAVAKQKIAEGWDVWLFASKAEEFLTDNIMRLTDNRCQNVPGETGLTEVIDLLSLVKGVVTNDSGLMHVSAALAKPIVALYGSTTPDFTPPLAEYATVLKLDLDCQPCFERTCPLGHHRCMRDLVPERVLSVMSTWGK